jgi:hypothetical protein
MKIPLSRNKVALIDRNMAHLLNWGWYAHATGYAVRNYTQSRCIRKIIWMQHAVVGQPVNRNYCVDHINGDKLDNRRENLRIITRRENCLNKQSHRNGRFPDARIHIKIKDGNYRVYWSSQIRIGKKRIHLGMFRTEQKASFAYMKALKKYGSNIKSSLQTQTLQNR